MIKEIWIPETIVVLFLFLPQLRSFFKPLEELPGLNWLPLLALFITAGIFPAYGFRLECVPLLVYALACNVILFVRFASSRRLNDGGFSDDDPGYSGPPLSKIFSFLLLGLCLLPAYLFAPKKEGILVSEGVRTVPVRDETRGRDYFVRIYDSPAEGKHPLILVIPPESGSVPVIDPLCDELRRLGFTVATYSRKGFDSPALSTDTWKTAPGGDFPLREGILNFPGRGTSRKYILSPFLQGRFLSLYRKGAVEVKANAIGRSLETGRLEDIRFLLLRFAQNTEAGGPLFGPDTVRESVFLAGYNAGGAGALYYASENGESGGALPEISGIIAIESNFWSLMLGEEHQFEDIPEGAGALLRFRINLWNRLRSLSSLKISGIAEPPETGKPLLLVASDRAFEAEADAAGGPYGALFRVFTQSVSGPRLLAAVPGAGPLDYSAIPVTKPLYSLLLRGKGKKIWTGEDYPVKTAGLIADFASSVLRMEEGKGEIRIDKNGASWEGLLLESRNSGTLRYILE